MILISVLYLEGIWQPLVASRCPNTIFDMKIEILINIYVFRHTWRQTIFDNGFYTWTTWSLPWQPDPYLYSLQIISRLPPKARLLFQISKLNILQIKSDKLNYTKAILMICLQIRTSWSRIQVVQIIFFTNKHIFWHTWRHIMFVIGVYTWTARSIPLAASRQAHGASKRQNIVFNI